MRYLLAIVIGLWLGTPAHADPTDTTPAEILLGNRLFDDTRFAQFFAAHMGDSVNAPLAVGDPAMDTVQTATGALPGPFAGQSMNCRQCHMDVQFKGVAGGGSRTYADFARRTPITDRGDGQQLTTRNSQQLMDASLRRPVGFFLHFDGEFPSGIDLVRGTLTGRNMGWLPTEAAQAIAHVARVIREDDGTDPLGVEFGGAYAGQFRGTVSLQPAARPVPTEFAIDVTRATNEEIVTAVARFLTAYTDSLFASRDAVGAFNGSPYDTFLRKNGLPIAPRRGESDRVYSRRLAHGLTKLSAPAFVSEADGAFRLHQQPFVFGAEALRGLRVFLARPRGVAKRDGVGNCVACHPAPAFTDFGFHATGAAQDEYDAMHGGGTFAALAVPALSERVANPDAFLPASASHPLAQGPFRAVPAAESPGRTDLGLWNTFQNPDIGDADQQREMSRAVCRALGAKACAARRQNPAALLDAALALFKTPSLRDPSHSGPYLHTGQKDELEDVLHFYRDAAGLARRGVLRNGARELATIRMSDADAAAVVAFLRSLNEDFE